MMRPAPIRDEALGTGEGFVRRKSTTNDAPIVPRSAARHNATPLWPLLSGSFPACSRRDSSGDGDERPIARRSRAARSH